MPTENKKAHWLKAAQDSLQKELDALSLVHQRLGDDFCRAVELIHQHPGKIVISGVGKSGHIGQKIASTFSSTGTPAIFMHAGEAVHGDLGIYQPGDPTILISKSGSHSEIVNLIPILKGFDSPLIAIVGNLNSAIARHADAILDASVPCEADPLGIVPTSSTLTTLAIGDALAAALMVENNFDARDFARFHPAGQLGRNLLKTVGDVMQKTHEVAWVSESMTLRQIVIAMTHHPQGAACVVDEQQRLVGLITEGDIRRALEQHEDFGHLTAKQIMVTEPSTTTADSSLADALKLMEDRPTQISVLPVLDKHTTKCIGLLRIHDAYQA